MKRTILCLAVILTTSWVFGQNSFPDNGNASIGTTSSSALLNVGGNVILSSAAQKKIEVSGTLTGGTGAIGILNTSVIQNDVLSAYYNKTLATTQAASFALPALVHYGATQVTLGAGSSITTQSGFWAESTMVGAGTNYGFRGSLPIGTGTANWNAYMGGTAPNYFNGDVLIGTNLNSLSTKLYVNGNGTLRPSTGGGAALNLVQTTTGSSASPTNNKIAWMTTALAECASIDVPDSRTNAHGVPMIFTTKDNTTTLTEKMRIANGGNVLIGTSVDQGVKLYVEKDAGVNTGIATFKNTNASGDTRINCSDSDGLAIASFGVKSSASTTNASYGKIGECFVRSSINSEGLVLSNANNVGNIRFLTKDSGIERMIITNGGDVGIGISTPVSKLHIVDTNGGVFFDGSNTAYNRFKSTALAATTGKDLLFAAQSAGNTPDLYIDSALGYVGIGTTSPDNELTVNGTIHAKEVKVTSTVPTPDYVFEKYYLGTSSLKPDYTLLTLSEVEKFTKENHHLPNVPSAKEIKENGLHLGEMSHILLQKIEELTLYSIDQQKTIEKQTVAIEKLEKENESFKKLERRLAAIEKELNTKK